MSRSSMFDELERALMKRGVAPVYAERYTSELRDHWDDLRHELEAGGMNAEEAERRAGDRLGSVDLLASAALTAYRRRTFIGRHVWFFFGVLPVLMTPVVMVLVFLVSLLPLAFTGFIHNGGLMPGAERFARIVCGASNYVVPGIMAMLVYRAAWRRALRRAWRLVACTSLIAWGAWLRFIISVSPHHASVGMGAKWLPATTQGLTAIGMMLIYMWLARKPIRRGVSVAG